MKRVHLINSLKWFAGLSLAVVVGFALLMVAVSVRAFTRSAVH